MGCTSRALSAVGRGVVTGAVLGLAGYMSYATAAWIRYGHVTSADGSAAADPLLDKFMPVYDVVERHDIPVAAPASITFMAAEEMDLLQLPVVRAIFKGRALVLRSRPT